jgi:hypothetical protein
VKKLEKLGIGGNRPSRAEFKAEADTELLAHAVETCRVDGKPVEFDNILMVEVL